MGRRRGMGHSVSEVLLLNLVVWRKCQVKIIKSGQFASNCSQTHTNMGWYWNWVASECQGKWMKWLWRGVKGDMKHHEAMQQPLLSWLHTWGGCCAKKTIRNMSKLKFMKLHGSSWLSSQKKTHKFLSNRLLGYHKHCIKRALHIWRAAVPWSEARHYRIGSNVRSLGGVGSEVFGQQKYWVVVSHILLFSPYLGKIPILTSIFQVGWNHQLE